MPLNVVGGRIFGYVQRRIHVKKGRSVSSNSNGVERKRHNEDLYKIVVIVKFQRLF